jgi:deoxycytidylate deaminase
MMAVADEIANYSEHPNYKVAAVIVYKGKIIASATNSFSKTHPIQQRLRNQCNRGITKTLPYAHAEVKAIDRAIKFGYDLSKCSIFVSRISKRGLKSISKPCNECETFIRENKMKFVSYYNRSGEIIVHYFNRNRYDNGRREKAFGVRQSSYQTIS